MKSPISRFTVSGNSMTPTLHSGQDVLSINWFVNPKVGDIVVIKKSGKEMVKRIQKVEDGKVFVVGDNPSESIDSRSFGPVNMADVVGKGIYSLDQIPCPNCGSPVIGVYGRKDAICRNCGFKLVCCGE